MLLYIIIPSTLVCLDLLVHLLLNSITVTTLKQQDNGEKNNNKQFLRTNTSTVYCSSLLTKGIRMEVRHPANDVC